MTGSMAGCQREPAEITGARTWARFGFGAELDEIIGVGVWVWGSVHSNAMIHFIHPNLEFETK